MADRSSKGTLWTIALMSIAAIIIVQLIASNKNQGAGPQPTSTGGGAGA